MGVCTSGYPPGQRQAGLTRWIQHQLFPYTAEHGMAQLSDDCFAFGGRLIPLQEARALIHSRFSPVVGSETAPRADGAGRRLAEDIVAPISVPSSVNSAVDGYAVHFDDLSPEQETVLPLQ